MRSDRLDEPGAWHHVMNRGIAKRTLFEGSGDIRFFLSRLAWAVHAEQIEIHSFCVMTTHFHLLVRSTAGRLSEVMRQVQLDYVRRFNRSRRRDGPLVRGRFASKPVLSWNYRRILVRYIDRNPVSAGICSTAGEYPYGSAVHYLLPIGPPWLERTWVESEVREATGHAEYDPEDYVRVFGCASDVEASFVERRLTSRGSADALDDLLEATPDRVLAWMRWKTRLADGTEPGVPVVAADCVDSAVRRARDGGLDVLLRAGKSDLVAEIHAGLLRNLAGASFLEIGQRTLRSTSNASVLSGRYSNRVFSDESFALHAARIAQHALAEQCSGTRPVAPWDDRPTSKKK